MNIVQLNLLISDIYPDKSDRDMPMATLLNATKAYAEGKIDYKEWCEWYMAWAKQMQERLQGGASSN
jgi:hypothetical protein